MNYVVITLGTLMGVELGLAAFSYGEFDDSPGAQLVGVVFIVGAVAVGVRIAQRSR